MWREPRWIAILVLLALQLQCTAHAANVQSKGIAPAQDIRVVSITPDLAGNFVLLNTQKSRQLPFPNIRYMPAQDGRVLMTVDFSGAKIPGEPPAFRFQNSAVRELRICQLQSYPPIMRISMLADRREVFNKVDFRSSPGMLAVHLPPGTNAGPASAYDKPPPLAPARLVAANQIPRTAPERTGSTPAPAAQLRGPIAMPVPSDAKYIAMETLPKSAAPVAAKVAPPPAASVVAPAPAPARVSTEPVLKKPIEQPPAKKVIDETPVKKAEEPPAAKKPGGFKRMLQRFFAEPDDSNPESAPASAHTDMAPTTKSIGAAEAGNSPRGTTTDGSSVSVQFSGNDPYTVRLHSLQGFAHKSFTLKDPPRFVVDLQGDAKPALESIGQFQPNDLIKNVRIGSPQGADDVTRIVFDLANEECTFIEALDQVGKAKTLSLHVQKVAKPIEAQMPLSVPPVAPTIPRDAVIVVDAGHGGSDPGAQRGDIQEKELTLAISEKLRAELQAKGVKVHMTRNDDTYVSLEDRVKLTNTVQPNAFVSVHINSLETNKQTTGIETYYQNEQSKDLAKLIHSSLVSGLKAPDRNVRKARFYVINHTPVPAVLAEVGFISNKEERDRLASSDYQKQVASALAEGVILFLAERGQCVPVARSQPQTGSASATGTISATPPSAERQSFTQNLHSSGAEDRQEKHAKSSRHGILATNSTADKHKSKSSRQPLKFKRNRLATTRSL